MGLNPVNIPDASGVMYNGGDIDYVIGPDPVYYEVVDRPLKNLAYRDNALRDGLNAVVVELESARGNISSLTGYLRVSLDDDGHIISGGVAKLEDIGDVKNPLGQVGGETIYWTGSEWDAIPLDLSSLGDVDVTGVIPDSLLIYDGSVWVTGKLEINDLTDVDVSPSTDSDVFVWNTTAAKWNSRLLGLADLSDVESPLSPSDADILRYDSGVFKAHTPTLNTLTDVAVSGPTDTQVLAFDLAAPNKWKNANLSSLHGLVDHSDSSADIADAITGAASPSASNVFATIEDLPCKLILDTKWFRLADQASGLGHDNRCNYAGSDYYHIYLTAGPYVGGVHTVNVNPAYEFFVEGIDINEPDHFDIVTHGGVFDAATFTAMSNDDFFKCRIEYWLRYLVPHPTIPGKWISGTLVTTLGKNVNFDDSYRAATGVNYSVANAYWLVEASRIQIGLGFRSIFNVLGNLLFPEILAPFDTFPTNPGYQGDLRVLIWTP